jgi:putative ABC transport system permease protein
LEKSAEAKNVFIHQDWWIYNKLVHDVALAREEYAHRTTIGWDVFVVSGVTSVLIALFIISFQSIKAAVMSPVKGLRSE